MSANEVNALLRAGIEAARAGNRTEARRILRQVLERDPRNESAWFWLASVAESQRERGMCLERVVQINPKNERAVQELAKIKASLAQKKSTGTSAPVEQQPEQTPAPDEPPRQPAPSPSAVVAPSRLKQSRQRGFFNTPTGILITIFVLIGGVGGVVALLTIPGLINQTPPITTTGPTATARVTLSFSAQQQTLDATRARRPPTATLFAIAGSPVAFVIPSWTPLPTDTQQPTSTPTATSIPLVSLSVIYSAEGRGRDNIGIYRMRADGQGAETLLVKSAERAFDVALSRDGKQIAFITTVDGKEQVAIADANGESVRVITKFAGKFTRTPAWSPDGKQLVVVSNQASRDELYIVAADGSTTMRLNTETLVNRDPGWSPDGKKILFAADTSGRGTFQIFTIDPDGKNRQQLTESQNSNINPSFSPDGSRIVFVSTRDRKANIYTMLADGSDELLFTTDDGNAENRDPAFSPDSRWIVFSSTRGGSIYNIFVMSIDGTQIQQITNQKNVSVGPRFMPTP